MTLYQQMPDGPNLTMGAVDKADRLWQSNPMNAIILPGFNICPGFGKLIAGTLVAKNVSTGGGRRGFYVPYCPSDYTNIDSDSRIMVGRTFLVADGAATANSVKVTIEDSYRFTISDEIIIGDNTTPPENLGAITNITRESASATITFTTAIGATTFTVANMANIHVIAGTATPWMSAEGVIHRTLSTGVGQIAQYQMPVDIVVPGNVAFNLNEVRNYDDDALTALGMRVVNNAFMVM